MRTFDAIRAAVTGCVAAAIVSGCAGLQPLGGAPKDAFDANVARGRAQPSAAKNLYVANDPNGGPGSVTVYVPGTSTPARTITDGICFPSSLTFDSSNNLYVTNDAHSLAIADRAGDTQRPHPAGCGPSVTVYGPGATTPSQTFTKNVEDPTDIVTDASGYAYISNSYFGSHTGNLVIYKAGTYLKKTSKGIYNPTRLVLDGAGTLYVANEGSGSFGPGWVSVYTGKGKNRKFLRMITAGIDFPVSLAVDSSNNLYVGNYQSSAVTVYAPGASTPSRTITKGVIFAFALAFDTSGNLYVANYNTVTVYAAGSTTLLRTVTDGTTAPYSLAFGSNQYLNVANLAAGTSTGSVTVYTPSENKLSRTIASGVANPVWIGFGP